MEVGARRATARPRRGAYLGHYQPCCGWRGAYRGPPDTARRRRWSLRPTAVGAPGPDTGAALPETILSPVAAGAAPEAALGDSAAAGGGEGRSNIRSGRRPEDCGRKPKVAPRRRGRCEATTPPQAAGRGSSNIRHHRRRRCSGQGRNIEAEGRKLPQRREAAWGDE